MFFVVAKAGFCRVLIQNRSESQKKNYLIPWLLLNSRLFFSEFKVKTKKSFHPEKSHQDFVEKRKFSRLYEEQKKVFQPASLRYWLYSGSYALFAGLHQRHRGF